jgi:transposase-like protein
VLEYTYKANDPKVKESIFEHAVNGTGTRATARLLGISKDTVTNVLKKQKI